MYQQMGKHWVPKENDCLG